MPFSFALCFLSQGLRVPIRSLQHRLGGESVIHRAARGVMDVTGILLEYVAWGAQWMCWLLDWSLRLPLILLHCAGVNYPVRLRIFVRVVEDANGEPAVPAAVVERWLRDAAVILGRCGISLSAEPISAIAGDDAAGSMECHVLGVFRPFFSWFSSRAQGFTPRITVYVVRSVRGVSGCSYPGTGWVLVGANADGTVIVHEIGHLCDLWTHSKDSDNVMSVRPGGSHDRITRAQSLLIRTSRFARAAPSAGLRNR